MMYNEDTRVDDEDVQNSPACDCSDDSCGCSEDGCDCADGDCDCDDEGCGCGHDHDHDHDHDHGHGVITMTDTETGEEFTFAVADDFAFEDEHYCVLVTVDETEDPEMLITKVVEMDDGSEGLMSLTDEEYDRIYQEYERICEEEEEDEEDA